MVSLQGKKLHKNISVMVSWNVSIRKASKKILFLMKDGKDPWENMNINYCFLHWTANNVVQEITMLAMRSSSFIPLNPHILMSTDDT